MADNAATVRLRRPRLSDPHRPQYHFLSPLNWMNDPNGLIHWRGQYHLFYQYNPQGPFHGSIHWGHAVSDDLIHWSDLPVALTPTAAGVDRGGCWSGCAVDHDGVPTLFYTGVDEGFQTQVVCAATGDDTLVNWEKLPANPLISRPPPQIDTGARWDFRDPFVWREGAWWYLIIGTRVAGRGGAVLLYRSRDLRQWQYMHPLLQGDQRQRRPFWTATMWECPNFIEIDGRRVLIVSFQDLEPGHLLYTGYFTGAYDDHRFTPQTQAILEYGGYAYAPQVMKDEQGRSILFSWLWEGRSPEAQRGAGWAGVMSLPRVLHLHEDGVLGMEPAPELQGLRGQQWTFSQVKVGMEGVNTLAGVRGAALEIEATFLARDVAQFGIAVRRSPGGEEETRVVYDRAAGALLLDRRRASLSAAVHQDVPETHAQVRQAPLVLGDSEPLHLHIFLDHSVIEVFANGRVCLSSRIYPSRNDSDGLMLLSNGNAVQLPTLNIWEMESIW